jgi:hypothetical protein
LVLTKRTALALTLILALLFSAVAGMQLVDFGRANPLPEMYMRATIENPKNTTYTTNTVALDFSAESSTFFQYLNFFYSLDAQEVKPIESMTVTGHEFIPSNPGVYRQWFEGSSVLSNLSEGWHNVTIYVTYSSSREDPPYGGPTPLANTTFMIALPQLQEQEPFPTTVVAAASAATIAVVGVGLLVYLKKRKH